MRRGSIFVILFVLVAIGVVAASQFLRSQPPLEVRIAVSPLAEAWARAAADRFNATTPLVNGTQPVAIRIQVQDEVAVWRASPPLWSNAQHPTGWMPAMSASLDYAREARLPYQAVASSTAQTLLVWGTFESRAAVESAGTALDWAQAQAIAAAERWDALPGGRADWGFVKFAFSAPENAIGGVGVLLSGAGSYAQSAALTPDTVTNQGLRDWLLPVLASVPNFNTLGQDPAAALTRGPSVGEIALLPESQWLTNLSGIRARESIRLSYPAYPFVFDFPLAVWSDSTTPAAERQAVELFAQWLLQPAQQTDALRYGLRPASGAIVIASGLFSADIDAGINLAPDLTQRIQPPNRDAVLRLLAWANNTR
jgi:hypothetical protein